MKPAWHTLHVFVESRDQGLSEPEGKHKLWSSHQKLRCQPLEEASDAFILNHV